MNIIINPIVSLAIAMAIGMAVGIASAARRQRAMNNRFDAFTEWWRTTGSGIAPVNGEDAETHAKRVAAHAWDAGFAQRDAA